MLQNKRLLGLIAAIVVIVVIAVIAVALSGGDDDKKEESNDAPAANTEAGPVRITSVEYANQFSIDGQSATAQTGNTFIMLGIESDGDDPALQLMMGSWTLKDAEGNTYPFWAVVEAKSVFEIPDSRPALFIWIDDQTSIPVN